MIKSEYTIMGVMSGTSLDGIDLVYASFKYFNSWNFEIIHSETLPYDNFWVEILKDLISLSESELKKIDIEYTSYLANKIKEFIIKNNISDIDAICSHGHTALHRPDKMLTFQIGNLPILASLLQQKVVCDFRVQDVKLGGQGAPLVPVGDDLLFSKFDYCLNLGGFANISTTFKNERIAYDICPVNIVLNAYVKQLGFEYDDKGNIASKGKINTELLKQLNALDFYNETHPKSLGLEWVIDLVFPLIDSFQLEVKDILRTFIEHIAIQISKELNNNREFSVLVTGGGVYNDFLFDTIKTFTNNAIIKPTADIIEFKEALIFGFLGVLKLRGENNCLKSVTGAKYNHSSGVIFHL